MVLVFLCIRKVFSLYSKEVFLFTLFHLIVIGRAAARRRGRETRPGGDGLREGDGEEGGQSFHCTGQFITLGEKN